MLLTKRLALKALVLSGLVAAFGSASSPAMANTAAPGVQTLNGGAAARVMNDLRLAPGKVGVRCGVQFTGTIPANSSQLWFTFNWDASQYIDWTVMSDSVYGSSEITLSNVATQRSDATHATYWLTVVNNTPSQQNFEGRYCILP